MTNKRAILPRLDYLLTFEIAAKLESFAGAARELNVSETAVSRKIRLLELHYQCVLFVRGHRSVHLTDAGRKLLNGVAPAIKMLMQVSGEMHGDSRKSTVRLAATHSVSSLWLMPRLRNFHESNPNITISLLSSDMDSECLSEDMDMAILRGDGEWSGFGSERLFGETVFPVCSNGYLESASPIDGLEDLISHAMIEVSNNHTEWLNWRTWLARKGIDPETVIHSTYVNTYPLAIQAAADGLGIALGWGHLVDRHISSGALVRPFGGEHVRTDSGYYLLRRQGAELRPAGEVVSQWLLRESASRTRYAIE
ncbi:MAG: LysR substrate-binding domain-containing protein [Roseovarius sp.]|nr:LysR substrate-binding domain-containing protein [Roseovarius sp.]MCY4208624.1 LysR substrate-binding domain-containing protein [Roseovarius sp.]MCY4292834.1 LysR substrate-binding domain-containing protein [Roseovarius sp.]MCY4315075.1 LysR substrate-binding domain-containing protein [Roseovarius sp.]